MINKFKAGVCILTLIANIILLKELGFYNLENEDGSFSFLQVVMYLFIVIGILLVASKNAATVKDA
ncbi:hypothetical protein [Moritella sp. F3]|uniref:hypothetical protein n=1 Tax=Moritella sp. F3 TaxID=2718882 RepID=UPI0018E19D8F|nr:hypothetical protein [Moritella sp. F3]GIC77140.1 hypothetical protein FMO001_18670 [Moritella sp. F1]GIC82259.1 hypothetical protein FMO003_25400 [Moritella sp. F3]